MKVKPPTQHEAIRSGSLKTAGSVLVVDDEKWQRDLISITLGESHEVRTASSVTEALAEVEKERPSLVIMDYSMPDVSGVEGLVKLRERHPDLPVIILTGHADLEIAREALRLGAREYMIKPFEPADMVEMVTRLTTADVGESFDDTADVVTENAPATLRRVSANIDLWRTQLPTVTSENRIVATFDSGLRVEAKVLRLNRRLVHAEVYDMLPTITAGSKVSALQVWIGERLAYEGSAELSNVMTTGVTRICEFDLEQQWTPGYTETERNIKTSTQSFITRWEATSEIHPEFKLAVANIGSFLTELRTWLERVEMAWTEENEGEETVSRRVCEDLLQQITPAMNKACVAFEAEAAKVPEEQLGLYAEYFRATLHPLMLCSPFVHRCFTKPMGYPGDFGVMNRMLDDPYEGDSLFAIILNAWVILSPAGSAYRNRVDVLDAALQREVRRVQALEPGRPFRVLSLGCGAARETQRFISTDEMSIHAEMNLFDFNGPTVQHANDRIQAAIKATGREVNAKVSEFSVQQMLAQGTRLLTQPLMVRSGLLEKGHYDLIYCAGLFDYLSDRVSSRLLEIFWTLGAPGSAIIVSNFTPTNPIRGFMDYALDWRLLYREERHMDTLVPEECAPGDFHTEMSPDKVEVFLHLRKPDAV